MRDDQRRAMFARRHLAKSPTQPQVKPGALQRGCIVSGTQRPLDLLEALEAHLHAVDPERFRDLRDRLTARQRRRLESARRRDDAWLADLQESDAQGLHGYLDEVWEAMQDVAPPGTWFGAHPGDGADYGYWSEEDSS